MTKIVRPTKQCFVCGVPIGIQFDAVDHRGTFNYDIVRGWRNSRDESRKRKKWLLKYKSGAIALCPRCFEKMSTAPLTQLDELADFHESDRDWDAEYAFCLACESDVLYDFENKKPYYILGKSPVFAPIVPPATVVNKRPAAYMLDIVCPKCVSLALSYDSIENYEEALTAFGTSRVIRAGNWDSITAKGKRTAPRTRVAKMVGKILK